MKPLFSLSLVTLASLLPLAGFAADPHAGHTMTTTSAVPVSSLADGLVKKVDRASARLTIAHGTLVNLAMPPMTMVFGVHDQAWLKTLKTGDKIRFMAEQVNGALVVTQLEIVK